MDLKEDTWKTCTLSLQKKEAEQTEDDLQKLQNLHQTWKRCVQTGGLNEFEDTTDLPGDTMEEFEEPKIDKSSHRHFLKSEWLQDFIIKKIVRTYRREMEEADQIYRSKIIHWKQCIYISLSMHVPFPFCKTFNYDVSLWKTLIQMLCSGHLSTGSAFTWRDQTTQAQREQRKRQRLMNLTTRGRKRRNTDARKYVYSIRLNYTPISVAWNTPPHLWSESLKVALPIQMHYLYKANTGLKGNSCATVRCWTSIHQQPEGCKHSGALHMENV